MNPNWSRIVYVATRRNTMSDQEQKQESRPNTSPQPAENKKKETELSEEELKEEELKKVSGGGGGEWAG
jgi:hypothetical protein